MMKRILAGAVALTIAGAGLALAQQTAPQQTAPQDSQRWRPSAEDIAALADARIAALKTGLKLTTDQEKHWPAVETAIRDLAKQRADRMKEFGDRRATRREARNAPGADRPQRADAIERLRRGADAMTARGAALKKLADASEPLYKSLDDGQKRRFALLLRTGGRGDAGGPGRWHRRFDSGR